MRRSFSIPLASQCVRPIMPGNISGMAFMNNLELGDADVRCRTVEYAGSFLAETDGGFGTHTIFAWIGDLDADRFHLLSRFTVTVEPDVRISIVAPHGDSFIQSHNVTVVTLSAEVGHNIHRYVQNVRHSRKRASPLQAHISHAENWRTGLTMLPTACTSHLWLQPPEGESSSNSSSASHFADDNVTFLVSPVTQGYGSPSRRWTEAESRCKLEKNRDSSSKAMLSSQTSLPSYCSSTGEK